MAPQVPDAVEPEQVLSPAGNKKQDLAGRLLKPAGDASKATLSLMDEDGKAVPATNTVKSNASGAFVFAAVPTGSYFVTATFDDKSTQEGLIASQTYYNPVSPGTTLMVAYAKSLLASKLIFIEDLPQQPLSGITFELDNEIANRQLALEASADGRLNQFNQLKAATTRLTDLINQVEGITNEKATANAKQQPPYATDAQYADKKKKLGL
jgi:hypothetical protein